MTILPVGFSPYFVSLSVAYDVSFFYIARWEWREREGKNGEGKERGDTNRG